MCIKTLGLSMATGLLLVSGAGCGKPLSNAAERASTATSPPVVPATTNAPTSALPPVSADTLARVHWRGKKWLTTEPTATYLTRIWSAPESLKLESQALDKLALALAGWHPTNSASVISNFESLLASQPAAAAIRPLLEDLLREEAYLEIRRSDTNPPVEMALAIKLSADQAARWQGALSNSVLSASNRCQEARVGDWTLVGLALASNSATNALLTELAARFQSSRPFQPFKAETLFSDASNAWFKADIDLAGIANAMALTNRFISELPTLALTVYGDGTNVFTRAQAGFAKPLPLELEPWIIPTNLVHDPLVSFTALRGLRSWLSAWPPWARLNAGPAPDQLYLWTQSLNQFAAYLAFPCTNASHLTKCLSERIQQPGQDWLNRHELGNLEKFESDGLIWKGAPYIAPFLRTATNQPDFVLAGLAMQVASERPLPPELVQELTSRTNLIAYDWELTGHRMEAWVYVGQLARVLAEKAQLRGDSAGLAWLKAVGTQLGNCATEITALAPDTLSFKRKSHVGCSALELHLLVDWLESPRFPKGLHTWTAPIPQAGSRANPSKPAPVPGVAPR